MRIGDSIIEDRFGDAFAPVAIPKAAARDRLKRVGS